jgi:RNA polymerase sigma factor (sigma-70 family)
MTGYDWLAERFEENRGHLRAVAYRMLGSVNEADDAIQETWLRLSRSDASAIENLGGWLTTVVARVCLDMLRSRTSRREESIDERVSEPVAHRQASTDPEREALLADSVGIALLVVLDRLAPAERLAFVLHDMFDVPFEEIAEIVGRSPDAARQLASRARRRVQGADTVPEAARAQQRALVNAFLAALRAGDVEGLIAVLDPDVVVRVDEAGARPGSPREARGARAWAKGAVAWGKGVVAFAQAMRFAQPALVDGELGIVLAPHGRLQRVLRLAIANGKIAQVEIIADAARLAQLEIGVLGARP